MWRRIGAAFLLCPLLALAGLRPPASALVGQTAQPAVTQAPADKPAEDNEVASLYRRLCQKCHGSNGSGSPARGRLAEIPDFTSRRWQAGRRNSQLLASILDGK